MLHTWITRSECHKPNSSWECLQAFFTSVLFMVCLTDFNLVRIYCNWVLEMCLKWIKLIIFKKDWFFYVVRYSTICARLVYCNLCCDFNDWCNEPVYGKMDELSKGMTQTGNTATTDKIQENDDGKYCDVYILS